MKLVNSIAVLSFLAFAGTAYAQTPAAAPAAPAAAPAAAAPAPATAMKSAKPRSAKSLDCSKQADTQKLHGKARHTFMSKCKKS